MYPSKNEKNESASAVLVLEVDDNEKDDGPFFVSSFGFSFLLMRPKLNSRQNGLAAL